MIILSKLLKKLLPWILLLLAVAWIILSYQGAGIIPQKTETRHSLVLESVESLGKLELVKYNFQEITELKKISAELDLKVIKFKAGPDSKGVLISKGEAVGCLDLTKIRDQDITETGDTVYLQLPAPELCYFKLDLKESKLYDLDLGYLSDSEQAAFMDELYKKAEAELEKSAIQSGLLVSTQENADLILKPFLEKITDKAIIINYSPIPTDTLLIRKD